MTEHIIKNPLLIESSVFFSEPEYSDWKCSFGGNLTYCPLKKDTPNWFHRRMGEIFFGFKWEKKPI